MRVIIRGQLTPERLAEAFANITKEAEARCAAAGKNFSGFFASSNLYLNPWSDKGGRVQLTDDDGDDLVLEIDCPPDVPFKPKTDKALRAVKAQAKPPKKQLSDSPWHQRATRLGEARKAAMVKRDAEIQKEREMLHTVTLRFAALVQAHGESFLTACNTAIAQTWQAKPRRSKFGCELGTPMLKLSEQGVLLGRTDGPFKLVDSPMGRFSSRYQKTVHHWEIPSWVEDCVPALAKVIETFGKSLVVEKAPEVRAQIGFIVSADWIHAHRPATGGFTENQLNQFGLHWPPPNGWVTSVVGTSITPAQKKAFEAGRRAKRLGRPRQSSKEGQNVHYALAGQGLATHVAAN